MKVKKIALKNIGPFKNVDINLPTDLDETGKLPVIVVTGENGTGKSIIIDSIRAILKGIHSKLERDIVSASNFLIEATFETSESKEINIKSEKRTNDKMGFKLNNNSLTDHFTFNTDRAGIVDWVVAYWTPKISHETYNIENIISPNPNEYLLDSLSGKHKNSEITALITYFDYLKSSDDPTEKEIGEFLFTTVKSMLEDSLLNGELKHVARKTLKPMISQNEGLVSLDKLSSGNLFLIQRLISLLGKMYSAAELNKKPISSIMDTPGILLIDEVENHLHPKWQKTFISTVQKYFPKLQIILTTHSPFIVASIDNAKVFVCENENNQTKIRDLTDYYSNKPVEEILTTPVFNTHPFNTKISNLLNSRKEAISSNDSEKLQLIEKELIEINPEYFSYLDINNRIKKLL